MKNPEKWLSEFGQRIKAEREKQGMTQQALADKAHTKQDYIAQIERGARNPSLRTFINIQLALDISADNLIYGHSNETATETDMLIKDFISFLSRKNASDILAHYEIARFLSKYIGVGDDC